MKLTVKTVGEMNAEEFSAACHAAFGLRPPKDPKQGPAYIVTTTIITAGGAVTDQDLIDRWVINNLLSDPANRELYQPLVERALGRPVAPDEPQPFDLAAIRREQEERDQKRAEQLFI